ncbi:MAG: acyltransferase [Salinivirgaceae bacterium]|nr:acyltransferase [Salinivirgaceae bacterium]
MTEQKKLSLTYRLLCKFGFHYSEEEYGNVSLWRVIKQFFGNIHRKRLEKMMDWAILDPFLPRKLRPKLLRKIGCNVGQNVFIGDYVRVDLQHANMIYIDDYAHITSGCRLLCHQRDLKNYRVGDNAALCGYRKGEIHIGKGVMVGMESTIMPGVTIGDGAIVGAGSLVVKDIPAWTVAMGVPAKVVKEIPQREETL